MDNRRKGIVYIVYIFPGNQSENQSGKPMIKQIEK